MHCVLFVFSSSNNTLHVTVLLHFHVVPATSEAFVISCDELLCALCCHASFSHMFSPRDRIRLLATRIFTFALKIHDSRSASFESCTRYVQVFVGKWFVSYLNLFYYLFLKLWRKKRVFVFVFAKSGLHNALRIAIPEWIKLNFGCRGLSQC
jgi:hypothetical protein